MAIEIDQDGNFLLSSRHLDEITKISRRLPNGNITLLDNGNFHVPPFSRAVEYHLDEEKRTSELVWEYRHSPDIYTFATGNVQRLPNGNTLISWGTENTITEVQPDGSTAMELLLSPLYVNYRTFRFPLTQTRVREAQQAPKVTRLQPPYPNPFNSSTTVTLDLGEDSHVRLDALDILGRHVATLQDDWQRAGRQTYSFDAGNLASGTYFLRLLAGGSLVITRVVLLR